MLADGGSIRLVMDGEALARWFICGETGGGALAGAWGFDSIMPPLIGS